jgi:oleate hydratase
MAKSHPDPAARKAYFAGGGVASLAAAAYLIRDGKIPGRNITVYEEMKVSGGCLDGTHVPEKGYVIRGGRMMDKEAYTCTYDLFSFIPSLDNPGKTVTDEILDFNRKIQTRSRARLVDREHRKLDVTSMGFSPKDRLAFVKLMQVSEDSLGTQRIDEWFEPAFFETNFWYMWCTTFAFQPWHSLAEFKRYLHRFIHEFPKIHTLAGVWRTPFNQYDSMTLPLQKWLESQGVHFVMNTRVTDIDFNPDRSATTAERIHAVRDGRETTVEVGRDDLVFMINGSMASASDIGSMKSAPAMKDKTADGAWRLWETIARKRPHFGRPSNYADRLHESNWESFTCTLTDRTFFDRMEKFSGNKPGTGALVTFKDSNWLMSIVLAYQPHFRGQPEGVQVFWGDGLFPDRVGNYVQKKMSDCTGEEILTELCWHLGFMDDLPGILQSAQCVPCYMPYIGSQFLTRGKGDRPQVVPKGSVNFAFLGQYAELPRDVVFTVEYSVRTAQTAVFQLLGLKKRVSPLYRGDLDPRVLVRSFLTMHRKTRKAA